MSSEGSKSFFPNDIGPNSTRNETLTILGSGSRLSEETDKSLRKKWDAESQNLEQTTHEGKKRLWKEGIRTTLVVFSLITVVLSIVGGATFWFWFKLPPLLGALVGCYSSLILAWGFYGSPFLLDMTMNHILKKSNPPEE